MGIGWILLTMMLYLCKSFSLIVLDYFASIRLRMGVIYFTLYNQVGVYIWSFNLLGFGKWQGDNIRPIVEIAWRNPSLQ